MYGSMTSSVWGYLRPLTRILFFCIIFLLNNSSLELGFKIIFKRILLMFNSKIDRNLGIAIKEKDILADYLRIDLNVQLELKRLEAEDRHGKPRKYGENVNLSHRLVG